MTDKTPIHNNKSLSLFFGILLIIIGLITINARIFVSQTTLYLFGWALFIGGGAECFASFYAGSLNKFFITLITGIISFVIGGIIVINPSLSSQTFAVLVSIVFIADGLFKIAQSVATRNQNWGWSLASGLILFLLGIGLWYVSPIGNIGLIGFIIGLAIVISGFVIITNAYPSPQTEYRTI